MVSLEEVQIKTENMQKLLIARGGQKIEMASFSPWEVMKGADFSNSAQEVGNISLRSSNSEPVIPEPKKGGMAYI